MFLKCPVKRQTDLYAANGQMSSSAHVYVCADVLTKGVAFYCRRRLIINSREAPRGSHCISWMGRHCRRSIMLCMTCTRLVTLKAKTSQSKKCWTNWMVGFSSVTERVVERQAAVSFIVCKFWNSLIVNTKVDFSLVACNEFVCFFYLFFFLFPW